MQGTAGDALRAHTSRGDIQGLRAFAVVVVVLCHAGLGVRGGFVGVDVFFVISGFVITALLLRNLQASQRVDFAQFYTRRARRLLPALTLVVLVTLALSSVVGSPFDRQQAVTALTGAGALLMVANAVIFLNSGGYFATPPTNNPLLNTWSLSVEEQFYLVFPLLLLGLWWIANRRARSSATPRRVDAVVAGISALAILSLALCVSMSFGWLQLRLTDPQWFAFYASPTRAWEFSVGCLGFLVVRNGPVVRGRIAATIGVLGWVCLLACVLVISPADVFPGWIAMVPALATVAVLVAGTEPGTRLVRITGGAVPRWLGDVSYSWYLWHWPLIAFAVMLWPGNVLVPVAAAALSLGIAALSLRFVENPVRFNPSISGRRVILLAGACVGSVLAVSSVLLVGSSQAWWSSGLGSMAAQVGWQHRWQLSGCNSGVPLGARSPECQWNHDAPGDPIYLLGDSHAGQLSEAVLGAAQILRRPVTVGTRGACPFLDEPMRIDGRVDAVCDAFVTKSIAWLQQAPRGDIVLASAVAYVNMPNLELRGPDGAWTLDPARKQDRYIQALSATVHALTSAGHRVHVLMPIPGFPTTLDSPVPWYPSQCSTLVALTDIAACGRTRSRADVEAETAGLEAAMAAAVQANGGDLIELRDELCSRSTCSTNDGPWWRYLDGSHLSVGQSQRLAPVLAQYVRGLLAPAPAPA